MSAAVHVQLGFIVVEVIGITNKHEHVRFMYSCIIYWLQFDSNSSFTFSCVCLIYKNDSVVLYTCLVEMHFWLVNPDHVLAIRLLTSKVKFEPCSGIVEASKKDPALTDLRFLQLSAGHSQTNLSGVFCLSLKPSACSMHIPAGMRASCHQITLPRPILHLISSTTWLTRCPGGKLPRRIYHVGLLLCRRWF